MKRLRVAMVVQRAGVEVNGGAEALCREVATAMSAVWDVTILTTTARDYATWEPFYEEGEDAIGHVPVRRFHVDSVRSQHYFDSLSARILGHLSTASLGEQEDWMKAQGPYSTKLLRYIDDHEDDFDLFIFYTYLYATTYFGLPLVAHKAFVAPFAHDEWPIHLSMWNAFFARPQRIIFSTPEERDFLISRFPNAPLPGPVIGIGVALPAELQPDRFRRRFDVTKSYAIYVGRIDAAKGCDQLLDDFAAYKRLANDDFQLVLLGRESMAVPVLPHLRKFGYIDERAKFDALVGSDFLVMPSALESLSIALLEAWSVGRPVLVNAASDVLVGQCRRAGGGLWYSDAAEFAAASRLLRGEIGRDLGSSGLRFVQERYTWPSIVSKYEVTYADFAAERKIATFANVPEPKSAV